VRPCWDCGIIPDSGFRRVLCQLGELVQLFWTAYLVGIASGTGPVRSSRNRFDVRPYDFKSPLAGWDTECLSEGSCLRQGANQHMRDTSSRSWHQWRVTLAGPTPSPIVDRFGRLPILSPVSTEVPERPAADGIRHKLVSRIRQEIAAGTYDTEEKWLAAEEELLRRIAG
jgi:hypothetical protein